MTISKEDDIDATAEVLMSDLGEDLRARAHLLVDDFTEYMTQEIKKFADYVNEEAASKPSSRINWKAGDTAVLKAGWHGYPKEFKVLGPAVYVQQWWVPVLDPVEEDPTFFKEAGLNRHDQPRKK